MEYFLTFALVAVGVIAIGAFVNSLFPRITFFGTIERDWDSHEWPPRDKRVVYWRDLSNMAALVRAEATTQDQDQTQWPTHF